MQLAIKMLYKKTLLLEVSPLDLIESVKMRIESKEGIPVDLQCLLCGSKHLENGQTLLDYNILKDSTITLALLMTQISQISLKKILGEVIHLPVDPLNKILPHEYAQPIKSIRKIPERKSVTKSHLLRSLIQQQDNRPMLIAVQTTSGKTLTLDVRPYDTVETIKNKIQARENLPADQQCLVFAKKQLKDGHHLCEYNIIRDSTINLRINSPTSITIVIMLPEGRRLSLDVNSNDTIKSIKEKIQAVESIPIIQQHLFLKGKWLANRYMLSQYNIGNQATLDLYIQVPREYIHIFVNMEEGNNICYTVSPTNTIASLKTMIFGREGIPVQNQCLKYCGRPLYNNHTLIDYNIQEQSVISLYNKNSSIASVINN